MTVPHRWRAFGLRRNPHRGVRAPLGISQLLGVKAALLCFAVCASALAQTSARHGGVLEFGVTIEPNNYDCHGNTSFAFLHPIAPHYSTLLKFDSGNYPQIVGDLAKSWDVSADRMTYRFNLRPNVFFHDGSKLTSADVKASYERIVRPPPGVVSAREIDFAAVAGIDTPDPLTIVFHLKWPEAAMLANFASPWNCIYSAAKLAEDPQFPKTHILGTGPFAFVEHVKGQVWRGRRWERYFEPERPFLDGYEARFIKASDVTNAYETGRIIGGVPRHNPAPARSTRRVAGRQNNGQRKPLVIESAGRLQYPEEAV